MPLLLSRDQHDSRSILTVAVVLFLAYSLASLADGYRPRHSLLTSSISWTLICITSTVASKSHVFSHGGQSQRLAWAAGGLLALAQTCERAVDGRGVLWARAFLPIVTTILASFRVINEASSREDTFPTSPTSSKAERVQEPASTLMTITASALIAVYSSYGSITVIALGLSYAVLLSIALRLVDQATRADNTAAVSGSYIYSVNGLLSQPSKPAASDRWTATARDVSSAAALATWSAAFTLESWSFGGLAYYGVLGQAMGDHWMVGQSILSALFACGTVLVHMTAFAALLYLIQRRGAFSASFVLLAAAVCAQLVFAFSLSRLWFAALCASSVFLFFNDPTSASSTRMRTARLLSLSAVLSVAVLTVCYFRQSFQNVPYASLPAGGSGELSFPLATNSSAPIQAPNDRVHPIELLIQNAESSWAAQLRSQSQSLEAAVAEYRRRYGIPPPPNFDKWYEFAKRKGVQLIDDYDNIHHSLLPFWALPPATIRQRTIEALGFSDNNLMGLMIREGRSSNVEAGQEWLQQAVVGMIQEFVQYLPDMDLAFNIHDEPRVVLPHDELSRMVRIAETKNLPAALANDAPKNAFSRKPKDLTAGKRIPDFKTTRFNVFAHQPTWIPSRLSCSPDSPARALDQSLAHDNLSAYAFSELGFIYNQTAFSDICNSPSLSQSHGFFDRPNAFNVVHDLFPIFSQSKMSSFQDILYPSPWYWYGKVSYNEGKDMEWTSKKDKLWWRGSTTGGFSRAGGWKRQHRQQFVRKVNGLDTAKIMFHSTSRSTDEDPEAHWILKEVQRQEFKEVMDVHFSHVGQCDPGDCAAQREFFTVVDPADQQDAWKYKYLLDIDGNAFSGRFYAFLQSHSLTFKLAVFREWHEEWIKPWLHYVPLSLRGDEVLEAVRFFDAEQTGRPLAQRIAENGRDWAKKALRNEDFEVYFFRLLLEYGRLVDDNRETIGYAGS